MELVAFLFQLADWLVFIAPVDDVDTFLQTDVLIIYAVNFVTPYAAGVTLLFQSFCSCIQIADEGVCSRAVFDSQHILCVTIPMLESIPFVIKVEGLKDAFIYVGDRWLPDDAIDGRYIFLPVEWENNMPIIKWYDKWDLSIFNKTNNQ